MKLKLRRWSRSKKHKTLIVIRNLLILALVFYVGHGFGSGQFSFSSNSLSNQNGGLPATLNYSSVNKVYQALKNNYYQPLSENQLLDGLKHGLAESTNDPYTEYFTAAEAKQFSNELNNSFSGIGAELGEDSSGDIQIVAPIKGFPADKAGIQAGDLIEAINGQSTSGESVDSAVDKIRGPEGSKVMLTIVRSGQELNYTIVRQNISLPSVNTKILPGNIGYMQVTTFAEDTNQLTQNAANQFKTAKVKGIILDLRDDPGGLLDAAIHLSSLWLPQGTKILDEKRGNQVVQSYASLGGDILNNIPTVVLIDSGSASASEITTGALHDNHAAYVIGEKSYGKGVVQDIVCISGQANSDGTCPADELKVTIASWYRPDGENINHKGITPDETVSLNSTQLAAGTDTQLQAAENYLNSH